MKTVLVRRAAVATLSTLVALLGLEAFWRTRTANYGPTTNPVYTVYDSELGWRCRPNVLARHTTDAFDVEVRTNSHGFRDTEFDPGISVPIVTLGDSLTFAWGVPVEDGFSALLEEQLELPVANLGVSGFSTDQELLVWRRMAKTLRPALTVLVICENDVDEAARPWVYGRRRPFVPVYSGTPDTLGPVQLPGPEHWLERESHLYRSLRKAILRHRRRPLDATELEHARRRVATLIEALATDVDRAGSRLLVVTYASPWLAALLSETPGLSVLDISSALQVARESGPIDFGSDPHWNARGHAVVAEAIAAAIQGQGLIQR